MWFKEENSSAICLLTADVSDSLNAGSVTAHVTILVTGDPRNKKLEV